MRLAPHTKKLTCGEESSKSKYLKTGELIEIIFPEYDVRYIAINDGVDTARDDILVHELDRETNTRKVEIFYSFVSKIDSGDEPTESVSYFRQIGADVKRFLRTSKTFNAK